jgi:N-acetylmuramoyl-L-alanine amidase
VVAALVLFAAALGAGVWWTLGHRAHAVRAGNINNPGVQSVTPAAAPPQTAKPSIVAAIPEANKPDANEKDDSESSPATPEAAGLLPKVTGIRHWSSVESSTVVIDMQDQVQYEAHRLPNPERIYFDLHDTTLAANFSGRTITINDALLQRIRVAQPMAGVTRIVLETNGASDFSVSLEPNPYRLVVEVRKPGSKPRERAKIDLFAPENPASLSQAVTKSNPPDQIVVNQKAPNQISLNQTTLNQFSLQQIPLHPIPQTPTAGGNNDDGSVAASKPLYGGEPLTPIYAPKLRIVLDAGHGGWDLGTVGRKGLLEKDLVLDIVKRLGHLVESRLGATVIYTRKDDTYIALEKRTEIANVAQANLFISVHANYSDYPSARGVEK